MKRILIALAVLCFAAINSEASGNDTCLANLAIKSSNGYQVTVASETVLRKLQPSFFGFNLEWLEFQLSLWDSQQRKVRPVVLEMLRAFPGAVYRYPGGTGSNYFEWRDATGKIEDRPVKQYASWLKPMTIEFGPEEYLRFIRNVGGEPWYVVNLYGKQGNELPSNVMAKSAGELALFLRVQKEMGLPPVLRWELGNELDRGAVRWQPDKLVSSALAAAQEIRKQDPASRFLVSLEEYPAMARAGYSASDYNKIVAKGLKTVADEYAVHLYYDDKPHGITIDQQIAATCRAMDDARSIGITDPGIWITEHAFVPKGAWETPDWKYLWPQTSNLQAAINAADMLIAAVQVPRIKGAMIHALHGTGGPWPMFHSLRNNELYPSVVMLALRVLRESMLPDVLLTTSESANVGGYNGGYDVRAAVMTDASHQHYSVWAINRSPNAARVRLSLPAIRSTNVKVNRVTISGNQLSASNYLDGNRVQSKDELIELSFDQSGVTFITLPPYSISSYLVANNSQVSVTVK